MSLLPNLTERSYHYIWKGRGGELPLHLEGGGEAIIKNVWVATHVSIAITGGGGGGL